MSRTSRTIFVRNLPYSCTKERLEEVFSEHGPVKQCFVVGDKVSGKSRGIGYVTYTLRDDAVKAKDQKISIDGRRLLLDFADMSKKVKSKKKKKKEDPNDSSQPENEEEEEEEEEEDEEEGDVKPDIKQDRKDKNEQEKMATLKYHRAKIVLLTGLENGLNEEKLNLCLQKLNVKHIAETKLVSDDSAHVKFKCIRDAKRAVNRLNNHEYKGLKLAAHQLSKDSANIPQKLLKKCRVIVRNLAFKCTENVLRKHFEEHGEISEVKIPKNADGQSLGFGFVQYLSLQHAKKAIDEMNSKKIKGRPVAVDWVIPKSRYETEEETKPTVGDEEDDDEGSFSGEGEDSKVDIKPTVKRKRDLSDDEGYSDNDDDVESNDDKDDHDEMEAESDEDDDDGDEDERDKDEDGTKNFQKDHVDVDEGKTVFIRNLSYDTEEDKVSEFFEQFGDLDYARVVVDFNTEHSKGMAFVKFKSKESADKCLESATADDMMLDGRKLSIALAVSRQKATEFNEKKKKEKKDNRNLYLAREGYVRPGTQAAIGLSETDLKKRAQVEMVKRQKLKNINIFVSTLRLCVRNIPVTVTDKQLKAVFLKAAQDKSAKITECRIMRDLTRLNSSGVGKSLGFGFVSFKEHQHALNALRQTNNNPETFGEKKRLIVEFSLENRKALEAKEKRISRQLLKKEILKKNTESSSTDKKPKIDKEKLVAVQKPRLPLIKLSEEDKKSKPKLPKGMPTHMGPKIRHKARQSHQVSKKSKKLHQPQQKKADIAPARKKQKTTKKNEVDSFDILVSKYKNKLMNQTKSRKWYD